MFDNDEVVHDVNFLKNVQARQLALQRRNEVLEAQMRVFNVFERLLQITGGINSVGYDDFDYRFSKYIENIENQKARKEEENKKRAYDEQEKAQKVQNKPIQDSRRVYYGDVE